MGENTAKFKTDTILCKLTKYPTRKAEINLENSNAENTIPISVSLMPFSLATGGKKGIKNVSAFIAEKLTLKVTAMRQFSFHRELFENTP